MHTYTYKLPSPPPSLPLRCQGMLLTPETAVADPSALTSPDQKHSDLGGEWRRLQVKKQWFYTVIVCLLYAVSIITIQWCEYQHL